MAGRIHRSSAVTQRQIDKYRQQLELRILLQGAFGSPGDRQCALGPRPIHEALPVDIENRRPKVGDCFNAAGVLYRRTGASRVSKGVCKLVCPLSDNTFCIKCAVTALTQPNVIVMQIAVEPQEILL